jgi:titin
VGWQGSETYWETTNPSSPTATYYNSIPGVYYFYVTAINAYGGESTPSNIISASPQTIPSAPQNLQTTRAQNQITLQFNIPQFLGGVNMLYYYIYRGISTDNMQPLHEIDVINQNQQSYSYTDYISQAGTYYYEVKAENMVGWSAFSSIVEDYPLTTPGAPIASIAALGKMGIIVQWTTPSEGGYPILQYHIY